MFTGLVEGCYPIVEIIDLEKGRRVGISNAYSDLQLGESISLDGICLTVTDFTEKVFYFTLSLETLRVTHAEHWTVGQIVNVERAMLVSARLGGHFVLGHVDGVCQLIEKIHFGDCCQYNIALSDHKHRRYLLEKGSVTLNGVSLTINQITPEGFTVILIPHSLSLTNFGKLRAGDTMNIELDYLVKAIRACQPVEISHE